MHNIGAYHFDGLNISTFKLKTQALQRKRHIVE